MNSVPYSVWFIFGGEYEDYIGSRIEIQRPSVDLATLVAITCEHVGICIERLSGRYKGGDVTEARKVLSSLAVGRYGQQVKEVARLLNKNPSSVSRWLAEVYEGSPDLNHQVDEIDRHIRAAFTADYRVDRTNDLEPGTDEKESR